jgi:hypothetical protein
MQGREREWRDWMRTVVRQVSAQDEPRTWHVTGGCDGDGVKVMVGGYWFMG